MTEKELFRAIHQCKDKYLIEALEERGSLSESFSQKRRHFYGVRVAVAALVCILFLGIGASVIAASSDAFRNWVLQIFGEDKATELNLADRTETDNKPGENQRISLGENVEIYGRKESFVCESHFEGEERIVDTVYSIQGNGLDPLTVSSFHGAYDGTAFSFDYAVINQEVCAFNAKGAINEVFEYFDEDIIYATLWEEGDKADRECIAALNIRTGEVSKLTDDDKLCNFVMSPNGKVILCNYRAEGYWTVFDIASGTEKKVEGIDGYARTKEIEFLDDYHVLTLGKPFMKGDVEYYSTYLIDLRTQEVMNEYPDYGMIKMGWSYTLEENRLKIYNIVTGDSFVIENVKDEVHSVRVKGDYVLFGDLEDENAALYLVNLAKQSFMEIDMPEELYFDVEMYLASAEEKLLLAKGTEAYLIDVSTLNKK